MFYRLLARLAGQVLLGLAALVWATMALFGVEFGALRIVFGLFAGLAVAALVGVNRGLRWASIAGAIALFAPIGLLAGHNGASPWAWLFWIFCIVATERWLRDGVSGAVELRDEARGAGSVAAPPDEAGTADNGDKR